MLSLLSASYGVISGIMGAIAPPDVDQAFIDELMANLDRRELLVESLRGDVEAYSTNLMLSTGNMSALNFLFFGIQMIGVIMMYRLYRMGFLLYAVAQIGLAFVPVIFGGFNQFGTWVLVVTLIWNSLWILIYGLYVRKFPKG